MSGIGLYESKRLHKKCASSPDFKNEFMCLAPGDYSKQCLTITFQSFATGIKVSKRNAASEISSEFIYLSENYCLKGIYHLSALAQSFDFLSDLTFFKVDVCERNPFPLTL